MAMDDDAYSYPEPTDCELAVHRPMLGNIAEESPSQTSAMPPVPAVEIRNTNSRGRHSLFQYPSDPDLSASSWNALTVPPRVEATKTRSFGYIEGKLNLTEPEKAEALRNLQRRSKQPEVFLFPEIAENKSQQHIFIPGSFSRNHFDANGYHSNGIKCDSEKNHTLVQIDYDSFLPAEAPEQTVVKPGRLMTLSERCYHEVVRRASEKSRGARGPNRASKLRLRLEATPAPKSFFDLAVFSCCCCLSPLGLIAVILSVKSGIALKNGNIPKSQRLSHATLLLSIVGIGLTIMITVILLVTKFYYWDDVYITSFDPGNG